MAKPKAVYVRWRDAGGSSAWQVYEGLNVMPVESIGWVIEDTKDKLVIASSYDNRENRQWADITVIPRECVVSKKVVKL